MNKVFTFSVFAPVLDFTHAMLELGRCYIVREHADNAVAMADFAIKTLQDHVENQIAGLEVQAAALEAPDAHA